MSQSQPVSTVPALVEAFQRGQLSRRGLLKSLAALGLAAPFGAMLADGRVSAMQTAPSGELILSLPKPLISLDPHGPQSVEESTAVINAHLLATLTTRDFVTGEILPGLATEWAQTDELTWTFTLRTGVTFHDGTPFTSADAKASLDRIIALKGPLAPLWALVDTTEAPDDTTLVIRTTQAVGTVATSATLLYIAPASAATNESFFENPVGIGPYKFVSWTRDSELVLEALPEFWDGPAGISKLTFRDIPEVAARVTSLETGEIDFTYALPADQLPALRDNSDLAIDSTPTYAYYFIWFNSSREPFTNPLVRQAMAYALDLDTIAADLLTDVGVRAQAPIPSTVFGYAPQTPYAYDPEKAKALLAEAGLPDGFSTKVIWVPDSAPQNRELLETFISYWDAVGIKVENGEMEGAAWLEDLLALNWDIDFQSNTVRTGDADFTLRRLYTSAANRNGYANPDLDKLLLDAAASADQAVRADLYAQACAIIWNDAVGIFPFDLQENYVHSTKLQGFVAAPNVIPTFTKTTVSE
ncbi:MAG: ABC transporter substrate-binding protein [Thermomicrobiales bacterium]